jgi:hypothetical protein
MPRSAQELAKLAARLASARRGPARKTESEYDRFQPFIETLTKAGWGAREMVQRLVEEGEIANDSKVIAAAEAAFYRRARKVRQTAEAAL